MMAVFNAALTSLFKWIFFPFQTLAPIWGMIFISLVTGVLMLWIFGKVSDQKAIKQAKDKIRGYLLGVRFFQHDAVVTLRMLGNVFRHTLTHMRHALVPMLIMLPPVILIIIQLNLRFSVRPLHPAELTLKGQAERTLLIAKFRPDVDLPDTVRLEAPEGVAIETPPVKTPGRHEVAWRIRADQPGDYVLNIHAGQAEPVSKTLKAGSRWEAVPAVRTGAGVWDQLLWPGEPPIPADSPLESIEVKYPPLEMTVFGWPVNWLVAFFILSIIFGFAFKGMMGVQI